MSTIVIYNSNTGFTEQYAKWIADELACSCKPLKQISVSEFRSYDRVIFGGWIMGNMIMGLEKLRTMTAPAVVFAVGSTPPYCEVIDNIREQNKLDDTPLFYMEGGFHFDQLGFVQKMILKTLKKFVAKKENKNRQDDFMVQILGTSFNHASKSQMEPLVKCIRDSEGDGGSIIAAGNLL